MYICHYKVSLIIAQLICLDYLPLDLLLLDDLPLEDDLLLLDDLELLDGLLYEGEDDLEEELLVVLLLGLEDLEELLVLLLGVLDLW